MRRPPLIETPRNEASLSVVSSRASLCPQFNSWTEAYEFPASTDGTIGDPTFTGKPFNDAYRYMDWLLTVPLLLIEIIFCM